MRQGSAAVSSRKKSPSPSNKRLNQSTGFKTQSELKKMAQSGSNALKQSQQSLAIKGAQIEKQSDTTPLLKDLQPHVEPVTPQKIPVEEEKKDEEVQSPTPNLDTGMPTTVNLQPIEDEIV